MSDIETHSQTCDGEFVVSHEDAGLEDGNPIHTECFQCATCGSCFIYKRPGPVPEGGGS